MTSRESSEATGSSDSRLQFVQVLCGELRASWDSGSPRAICELISELDEDKRPIALQELLCTELEVLKAAGKTPRVTDYNSDYPNDRKLVRRAFARVFPTDESVVEDTVVNGEVSEDGDSDTALEINVRNSWLNHSGHRTASEVGGFARRAQEAGLVSGEQLTELRQSLPDESLPVTASELADLLVEHGLLTDYQVAVLRGWTTEPLVLGNYVVLDVIGSGGMGTVYKAKHTRMERTVALKALLPELMSSPSAIARFQNEVQAAAQLEHPNIVMAYDADEDQGVHFLVMQYVEGRTLADVVHKEDRLDPARALEYLLQIAKGLEYAHDLGIVHRDIKPTNLLLDEQGVVRILDMGLARFRAPAPQPAGSESMVGTVDFMAPEQGADSGLADARSDIYSLGCTLWYLLTGRRLFSGDDSKQRMRAHAESPRPMLSIDGAHDDLQEFFECLTAIDPADRIQSCSIVVKRIDRLLSRLRKSRKVELGESSTIDVTLPEPPRVTLSDFGSVLPPPTSDEVQRKGLAIAATGILAGLVALWLLFSGRM